ncbi:stage II sporulation protein D [Hydrogenispora ethanolica]|uniref:Stage II sporulation protein D n=1 Tax=Hydrogenispora ethanolica TaxID=1082276 RepID=A0A4R1S320_HYDET|nr:stage II sporulation protein D [Hydrogenispora ethanolica]TCL73314.1 stage II sporulation protein D [Hydrogenispora ethanolica]
MRPNHGLIVMMFFLLLVLTPIALLKKNVFPPAGPSIPVTLLAHGEGRLYRMDLEEYIIGVLAAEMPARFELEALKAQAVCSRTIAVRRMRRFGGKGCPDNPAADFSDDPGEAQAWTGVAAMRQRWGDAEFNAYYRKIQQAVRETAGIILVYQGRPIDAVFHSTCGVGTAAAAEVWGNDIPYLQSVSCGYDRDSPRYLNQASFTWNGLAAALGIPVGSARQLKVASRSALGRVLAVTAGPYRFGGKDFRARLGLTSTRLGWQAGPAGIVFQTVGNGHGVGLCQYGANGMAKQGRTYRQILLHYYQGVQLVKIQY